MALLSELVKAALYRLSMPQQYNFLPQPSTYFISDLQKVVIIEVIITGGGVYKVPIVVAYKVPIVVAYKVLNSISKKRSPRFGSRKVCL